MITVEDILLPVRIEILREEQNEIIKQYLWQILYNARQYARNYPVLERTRTLSGMTESVL